MKSLILLTLLSLSIFSAEKKEDGLEPMVEPIEFDKIKDVIKKDRLKSTVTKKKKKIVQKKKERTEQKMRRYDIPSEDEFWSFFSEYWLVKNVTILKWDFKKPDYGLEVSFRRFLEDLGLFEVKYRILLVNTPDISHFALPSNNNEVIFILGVPFIRTLDLSKLEISILLLEDYLRFLEDLGLFEVKYRILLVNTPDISHFALPSNNNEVIFILGVPFIRTLDLSKLEISILLLEDYLRVKEGYFKDFVSVKGTKDFIGGNFYNKDLNKKLMKEISEKYDEIIFDKGFNFQQQFKVTNKMNAMLKSNIKWWNGYFLLLNKIDNLVKTNILYQKYLKIYPSPELQIGWLKPQKKQVL